MPSRWIAFPPDAQLYDEVDEKPIVQQDGKPDMMTTKRFLNSCMLNPVWELHADEQADVWRAYKRAFKAGEPGFWLSDGAWQVLKQCVVAPQWVVQLGRPPLNGFGFHPALAHQLVPWIAAVRDAPNEDEKTKRDAHLERELEAARTKLQFVPPGEDPPPSAA